MSEAAAPVAPASPDAPSTPAPESEAPAQPQEAPQEQPTTVQKPPSVRESYKAMKEGLRQRAEGLTPSPKQDERGNLHDPDTGKFVEKSEDASEASEAQEAPTTESPPPETQARDEPSDAPATTPEDGAKPPDGMVRIELPANHPLRTDRGKTHITVQAEDERDARAMVNGYARNAEAEQARNELEKIQLEAAKAKKAAEFWEQHTAEFFGPEFRAKYEDIKQTYGDEDAERFKRGVMAEAQKKLAEHTSEVEHEHTLQRQEKKGRAFIQQSYQVARKALPYWDDTGFQQAMTSFLGVLDKGLVDPTPEAFIAHARPFWVNHPRVKRMLQEQGAKKQEELRAQIRQEIEAEAEQREKERLEQAASKRRTNPLGVLPPSQSDRTTPGDESRRPASYRDFKKDLKERFG